MLNELAGKMHTLLEDFARTHGYYLIIEAGNPDSPVVVTRIDVTDEIVALYDQAWPAKP